MAEFSGIRNENEFYFAHYLASLMDDELKEACQSAEMKAAFEKVSKLGLDYHALAEARALAARHRSAAFSENRKAYLAKRRAFVGKLADLLGYADVFASPGTRLFPGQSLTIPVSGILADKDGGMQALLIESYRDADSPLRAADEGILENFLASDQLAAEGLPETSRRELSVRVRGDRSRNQMPTWENLLSNEIFAAPNAPRFVVVFGEDSILLADKTKWAERRTLIFDLDEIYERGERATFRAMVCLLAKSSLAPNGSTPLPDKLDENSHKNAFGVSKSLRYAMREAIELLGNAILESLRNEPQISADCRRSNDDTSQSSNDICGNLRQSAVQASAVQDGALRADRLTKECILVMYRFLFVLFLESRKDLGYFETVKGGEDIFWSAYGFDHLRDLETVPLLTDADRNGHYFDLTVKQLFDKIWKGAGGHAGRVTLPTGDGRGARPACPQDGIDAFRIQPLKAHLFDPERTPFFNKARIPNEVWQRIVYSLSIGEAGTGRRKRKGRISYAQLGIQQLGAVYEALLSYTGFYAQEDLYEVQAAGVKDGAVATGGDGQDSDEAEGDASGSAAKNDVFETGYFVTAEDLKGYTNAEKAANPDGTLVCHRKGSFIYRMAGRDRERSASYYTPEVLTRCLVRLAIKERVTDEMSADEVMTLTVCEPAMGSAAFLNETIDQLADIYLRKKQKELKRTIPIERYAAEKARVKMVIADNNVFGVDLNPTAADLAEVSLWLGSIGGERLPTGQDREEPYIPWFGTQLKCGNSIVGCRREVVFKDGTRRTLGFGEPFPENAVWHFLLPDEGMALKLDKVVKGLLEDEPQISADFRRSNDDTSQSSNDICGNLRQSAVQASMRQSAVSPAGRLKRWSKAFALPDKKKERAKYDNAWARLARVSKEIERLWQGAAKDIQALDDRTRDDIAYFGHEPKPGAYQDIKSKDRQLNTEISRDEYGNVDYTKSLDSVTDYFRLKTILDLWCALWFWPLDQTDALPTWSDFETLVGLLARNEFEAPGQMKFDFLGDVKMTTEGVSLANRFKAEPTLENLYRLFPFAKTSQQVAEHQHFLHWELEFAPVFKRRGGFDLIVGNPPWVKVQWNEQGILSEYDPHIAVRKISASDTMALRENVFRVHPGREKPQIAADFRRSNDDTTQSSNDICGNLRQSAVQASAAQVSMRRLNEGRALKAYLDEYTVTTGTKAFLGAAANYPTLAGVQTNLFKFFLPLAFRIGSPGGVAAFVHPEGVYDDPNGGPLRAAMYPRLRLHAQFINELKLFDIDHHVFYSLNVYGPARGRVAFRNVSRLYHPNTLEDSLRMAGVEGEETADCRRLPQMGDELQASEPQTTEPQISADFRRSNSDAAQPPNDICGNLRQSAVQDPAAQPSNDICGNLRQSAVENTPLPLERNERGTWNIVGHPDRVVSVDDETLTLFATLYDDEGTPSRQARLPALYTRAFLSPILSRFASSARKMADLDYGVSVCWDETGAPKAGIIKRQTGFVSSADEVIYSGPQFFVGNPMNKTARPQCRLNSDYDNIDLTVAPEDYTPRTNYVRLMPRDKYDSLMPTWKGRRIAEFYRVLCRHMISCSAERSLIPAFAPKGWAHINGVIEFFNDTVDMSQLTSTFGALFSVPFDWFVKMTGKSNLHNDTIKLLPALPKNPLISARALLLNCLNRDYAELWREAWDEAYRADGWLSADPHLTKWCDHVDGGHAGRVTLPTGDGRGTRPACPPEWNWHTPLRTQLDRRQALVELDVIVTKALGLSLDDLLLMYRVSFPTMRKYDADTYYDQNGRCVFSVKSGESYLSRKEWEAIREMPSGEFRKTVTETVFSDTPTEREIVYKAPFFRKNREADYREAWEMLEARG